MGTFQDHTGKRFGRLEVLELDVSSVGRHKKWICRCDCGNVTSSHASNLTSGKSASCGCKSPDTLELLRARSTKHGMSRTKTYKAWMSLRGRCLDQDHSGYKNYGGRGIQICERWRESFENFYADMGAAPPGHSIDRIENDGNYEPSNCRWATAVEQQNNRRVNTLITANGKEQTLAEWGRETGIPAYVISSRIRIHGWSTDDAVNTPKKEYAL